MAAPNRQKKVVENTLVVVSSMKKVSRDQGLVLKNDKSNNNKVENKNNDLTFTVSVKHCQQTKTITHN